MTPATPRSASSSFAPPRLEVSSSALLPSASLLAGSICLFDLHTSSWRTLPPAFSVAASRIHINPEPRDHRFLRQSGIYLPGLAIDRSRHRKFYIHMGLIKRLVLA